MLVTIHYVIYNYTFIPLQTRRHPLFIALSQQLNRMQEAFHLSPLPEGWEYKTQHDAVVSFVNCRANNHDVSLFVYIRALKDRAKHAFKIRRWRRCFRILSILSHFTSDTVWIVQNQKKCLVKQQLHEIKKKRNDMKSHQTDEGYDPADGVWEECYERYWY